MEKIALLMPTYAENPEAVRWLLHNKKYEFALNGHTYQHYTVRRRQLKEQRGGFKVYVYLKKTPYAKKSDKGSGMVEYIYHIEKDDWNNNSCLDCPEDKKYDAHLVSFDRRKQDCIRCWNYIKDLEKLDPPRKWGDFRLYPSERRSKVQCMKKPEAHWCYVYDDF